MDQDNHSISENEEADDAGIVTTTQEEEVEPLVFSKSFNFTH